MNIRASLCIFLLLFTGASFAEDSLWDLDGVLSQVQNSTGVNLTSKNGFSKTLSKDYVLKLDEIRKKISEQSGIYPKFIISSNPEVNAGATWINGQPVTVFNLGLLSKVGTDYDAIAAVVSHEFSHLTLRHQQSQQTTNAILDILGGLALIAIDSKYGGRNNNPYHGLYKTGLDLTESLAKNAYSRSDELAADAQGIKYMVPAGFSPEGALRLQESIIPSNSSFFSTHPSSSDRIQNIRMTMSSINYAPQIVQKDPPINVAAVNPAVDSYKNNMDSFLKTCEDIGFTPNTIQYGDCIYKFTGKRMPISNVETKKAYVETQIDPEVYVKTCKDIGFRYKTSKFQECLSSLKNNSNLTNLPSKGQIGSVVSIKEQSKNIIIASSIPNQIPLGTKVKIMSQVGYVDGTIDGYYDGYYSATVNSIQAVKQGSRIVISN